MIAVVMSDQAVADLRPVQAEPLEMPDCIRRKIQQQLIVYDCLGTGTQFAASLFHCFLTDSAGTKQRGHSLIYCGNGAAVGEAPCLCQRGTEAFCVSRSGYNAWKKRCPSVAEKHRGEIKEKILKIYEDSHQNYGAPKI